MAKYDIQYAPSFWVDMDKLDRGTQRQIARWIDKHLHDVDFPTVPGKVLKGNLANHVRFRCGDYRIIATIDEGNFVILNLHVAHRRAVYKTKK